MKTIWLQGSQIVFIIERIYAATPAARAMAKPSCWLR